MSGSVSTMPIAKPSKVCTSTGVTGGPPLGAGTYQSCLWLSTVTRIDPSARTARFSRKKCGGKLAIGLMSASAAVATVVFFLAVMACNLVRRGYLEQGERRADRVVLADERGDVEQTCCAEGFLGLTVEFVFDAVTG